MVLSGESQPEVGEAQASSGGPQRSLFRLRNFRPVVQPGVRRRTASLEGSVSVLKTLISETVCRFYAQDKCHYGDKCKFSHGGAAPPSSGGSSALRPNPQ